MENVRRVGFKRNLIFFLGILGPGFITGSVDNDVGGITTYSVAGAMYGYKLLWTLIPAFIVLYVVQEMNTRMGIVTGKGLADLIRETAGIKITFFHVPGPAFLQYIERNHRVRRRCRKHGDFRNLEIHFDPHRRGGGLVPGRQGELQAYGADLPDLQRGAVFLCGVRDPEPSRLERSGKGYDPAGDRV